MASLKNYFSGEKAKLCADCHYRLEKNVLRIFDCKNEGCQPVIQKAPWEDFCSNCRKNFDEVKAVLKTEHGITPQIERRLVRGLDYYPSSFTVKKGIPVEWNIDGRNAQGCAKVISVPALKILERLPYGVKTIKFTPQQTGNIMFSCSMGMAGPGTFKIIA